MSKGITTVSYAVVSIIYLLLLATYNSVSAQNMTNHTLADTNMTNMTTSDASTSPAKLHLREGIIALEKGDNTAAMIHLNAAQQAIASSTAQVKMHFDEGMKAMSAGDSNGALVHLKAADAALG